MPYRWLAVPWAADQTKSSCGSGLVRVLPNYRLLLLVGNGARLHRLFAGVEHRQEDMVDRLGGDSFSGTLSTGVQAHEVKSPIALLSSLSVRRVLSAVLATGSVTEASPLT